MMSNQTRLTKLLSTKKESTTTSSPKIQRVQPHLRDRNAKYYTPKLVSFGPIHCHSYLPQGKTIKNMWAAEYLKGISTRTSSNNQQTPHQLLQKIEDDLPTLKGLYTEDMIKDHNDHDLAWMFFQDGCAVLYFMEKASIRSLQELKIKVDQLVLVQYDLFLLENQLPFRVLRLLSNDDSNLENYTTDFLKMHHMVPSDLHISFKMHDMECIPNTHKVKITVDQPIHLLHILCSIIIRKNSHDEQVKDKAKNIKSWPTHRNVQELKKLGIHVRKHKENDAKLTHIDFKTILHFGGRLYFPKLVVDNSTVYILLNLIAFEMCPDFENGYEISSYVTFLDSLIDHAEDVKELRKADVLHNALGSDEDVATLFNTISSSLVLNEIIYQEVGDKIEGLYRMKQKTSIAQAFYIYFNSSWSLIGLISAFMVLFLTFVQIWLGSYPSHNA